MRALPELGDTDEQVCLRSLPRVVVRDGVLGGRPACIRVACQ
ncbi:MAG: hypothetical protein ACRDTC_21685 [Pseudonocardiaceae bacterium]